ncbi:hypothetical protein LIER_26076 [Lithospermum erythrorhizon]|uniref:Uncharacterized protein n=1 Tax=Lithospermum erythrorhizon TaxID=34254 RepID=A0AAV3R8M8_LITER
MIGLQKYAKKTIEEAHNIAEMNIEELMGFQTNEMSLEVEELEKKKSAASKLSINEASEEEIRLMEAS